MHRGEDECQTLWDDIFDFAFPEDDFSRFDSDNDEYFLGPIVTFKNDSNKLEIIDGQQPLINLNTRMEIEHIFPRKRQENEGTLADRNNLEALGNKALLEKSINIRASDYRFEDKKKYYKGFTTDKGKEKQGTMNVELLNFSSTKSDFDEADIKDRTTEILTSFVKYVGDNDLFES